MTDFSSTDDAVGIIDPVSTVLLCAAVPAVITAIGAASVYLPAALLSRAWDKATA